MTLTINLKDPKYCDDCLAQELRYKKLMYYWCRYYNKKIGKWKDNIIRPQRCIKENGE